MSDSSIPYSRTCIKCGEEKPLTPNHFHKDRANIYGFNPRCKSCVNGYGVHRGELPTVKLCKCCAIQKPLGEFTLASRGALGRRSKCKACEQIYHIAVRDETKERGRQWRLTNKNKANEYSRKRYQDTKEQTLARKRKYRAENPHIYQTAAIRRRARKLALPDTLTAQEWQACLDYFNGCCAVCGRPPGLWHTLAADHWIPLANPDCPGTVKENMIPLCHGDGGCNNGKSNKPALEWLTEKHGKRKASQILARIHAYFEGLK